MNIYRYIKEKIMASDSSSGVETDLELNGTVFNNCVIPPDVITNIMEFLDGKSILACRLVCKNWEELVLLTLQTQYRHRFSLPTDGLSLQYLYIRLYTNIIGQNLLKNVNGEQGFKHWEIIKNGGNQFAVEEVPQGCDPLPGNIEDFNGNKSCFVTSYYTCRKEQVIEIGKKSLIAQALREKPKIYASEWIAGRFDCGGSYNMMVTLYKDTVLVAKGMVSYNIDAGDASWKKVDVIIPDYEDGITHIVFEHEGKDSQFWAGHYGVKMAGAVLKLLPTI